MNVNVEFLGKEPIENLITCMNFKMDKTIYFGYSEVIEELSECTTKFLMKYCGMKQENILFKELSHTDFGAVLEGMREILLEERAAGNRLFFDITGGESLILVAFGVLSREFDAPMHLFDVPENRLIELEEGASGSVKLEVPKKKVQLSLDAFIEMRGGVINYNHHKAIKSDTDGKFRDMVPRIWKLAAEYEDCWNAFSALLREHFVPDDRLHTRATEKQLQSAIRRSNNALKDMDTLNDILNRLEKIGAIKDGSNVEGVYNFRYGSQAIKDCLWDGGSILELHTYYQMKQSADDCRVGVHIDWDGTIHRAYGKDVLNEIDVLTLQGNVLTFISCKSGNMDSGKALNAMYELETVARRFGGKYVKKVLSIMKPMGSVYLERAKEMGIEVWDMNA